MDQEAFTHHIVSIGWHNDAGSGTRPAIELREQWSGETYRVELESRQELNWMLSEERYCSGWRNRITGENLPCKLQHKLAPGYDLCPYCNECEGFRSAFFFGNEPNPHMREFLSKPQYIYLAYFEPQTVKVGTAVAGREEIRLIEQDALVGMIIATADGFSIQRLEHAISNKLGFTEFVKSGQKFAQLANVPALDSVTRLLSQGAQQVRERFKDSEFGSWLLPEIELKLINHSASAHIFYPTEYLHKPRDARFISGKYRGLRHKYLILENSGSLVALNKRYLEGRLVRLDGPKLSYKVPVAITAPQRSLFDI